MNRRSAFTLVELLVVSGIFAMLFSLIVVGGRPSTASQVKRAAQGLAAALVQAQSRSLVSDLGAGVIIEMIAGSSNLGGIVCDANPRPSLRGTAVLVMQSATTALLQSPAIFNEDPAALPDGYRIQFRQDTQTSARPSVFFRFRQGSTAEFRDDAGQTANNTIWPNAGACEFLSPRYPARGLVRFTLPSQAAVDLRFSGLGDDPFYEKFGSFKGVETVAACFDTSGHNDSLMRDVYLSGSSRAEVEPFANVYFLLASRDAIANLKSLAGNESTWVVLKPSTGRVTVAGNVPQSIDESLLDAPASNMAGRNQLRTALWNARQKARAGAAIK
jgi:prepilin-type N-terminal cleavage/methylation domain-containing protein